jgi:hypothetical protein
LLKKKPEAASGDLLAMSTDEQEGVEHLLAGIVSHIDIGKIIADLDTFYSANSHNL